MQVVQVLECVFITPDSLLAHYRLTIGSLLVAIWVDIGHSRLVIVCRWCF